MSFITFGEPVHAPSSVRVPFQAGDIRGFVTFTRRSEHELSAPLLGQNPLWPSQLARAAAAYAARHRARLLEMIAETEVHGFLADAGIVVCRIEDEAEFGLVSFWSPDDHEPGWVGCLSRRTIAEVVGRFHSVPLQQRQELFRIARAHLHAAP